MVGEELMTKLFPCMDTQQTANLMPVSPKETTRPTYCGVLTMLTNDNLEPANLKKEHKKSSLYNILPIKAINLI